MPRYEGEAGVSQSAASELRTRALSEAREILANQQDTLRMKKTAAQKLYQLALQLAERELANEEGAEDAD